jgi:hypothetical protein
MAQRPKHSVAVESLDVGIFKALTGPDGGYESTAIRVILNRPNYWVGTANDTSLVFSREDHSVVVSTDFFEASALATSESLPYHERFALDV